MADSLLMLSHVGRGVSEIISDLTLAIASVVDFDTILPSARAGCLDSGY